MQMKKIFKISAVVFCVLALLSLLLPFYTTYSDGGESYNMVVRGYNAVEFSAWGGMLIVLPITLIGIMFGNFKNKFKQFCAAVLPIIIWISVFYASDAMSAWVQNAADGYVNTTGFAIIYPLLMLSASIMFYLSCGNFKTVKEFFVKN